MLKYYFIATTLLTAATNAHANQCDNYKYNSSPLPHLQASSVPNDELGQHLNASQYSHGIKFDIEPIEDDLWVDIVSYPPETQLAAGLFMLLQIGRLAEQDFKHLVLIENSEKVFSFDGLAIRRNGCKALWGTSAAGSPMMLLVDVMTYARDAEDNLLIPRYTGNWLTDMTIALETFNTSIAPEWIFSASE
ncbi:hypothetical protein LY10_03475 [Planktotalea frisia]|uniref:Uncharacterized protein n=1 Tax=Planktotalea frisia TaxID=696762 RepID=A0A1L9NZ98_9RHOB|nr:hypothetical protein [Planktotalea frisia]OJI94523.1 hypothetical protein PFRI_10720 [Planktotalea frisia]PZX21722.1 hypothetical protein LY10_03475 [Planktotalea frisia]